ncbi:Scr1 family TA system antitoxin-like transcriptional regulator [Streptomyces sp. NPDC057426]|uniref:helix-turn-helix domain-containing protein n=1 Tax=Streptomyces sp. NPDC057426 TaxID=3346128 RepID=UPI0036A69C60
MPGAKELDPGDGIEQYLGNVVREARLALGREWTQAYVATKAFSSGSRISGIERGEDPPDRDLAKKLEVVLRLPPGSLVNLVKILGQQSARHYAKALSRQSVQSYAKTYMRRQLEAIAVHEFSVVVPGLLQTAGYARALMETGLRVTRLRSATTYARAWNARSCLNKPNRRGWSSCCMKPAYALRWAASR